MQQRNESRWVRGILARRRFLILATSASLATISYLAAFWVRAEFALPEAWRPGIIHTLPFLLVARLFAFRHYGLLQGWWTGTGMHDFLDIVKSVCVGSALFVTSVVLAFGVYAVPRSVVLIDATLLVALLSGSRLLSRAWRHRSGHEPKRRTLVVGALPAMESLVRDLVHNDEIALRPVGLLDLEGRRSGLRLHGVPILGGEEELPGVLVAQRIDTVLLALSTREAATVRRIISRCGSVTVRFKIVPPLRDLLDERSPLGDLRDVRVDDLLGRTEVRLDVAGLRETLAGRRVLITGAAGSIGSELARQVARYGPRKLILLDRSEGPLFALSTEFGTRPGLALSARLCDVRNRERLREIFAAERPEIVYHAAAYKHVPMMEMNPVEAVKNNVLATRDLLSISDEFGVDKFVLISTDKAVRPINIMGATKQIAERLLETGKPGHCRRIAVRFGNVFGSEGSVVPILLRQIQGGGPVTITHPEATRYFMTIPESVQLVLQASAIGRGGEIFVLEMGEPIRILDLATSLIRLAGRRPNDDIPIRITGLRPGERLHEEALIDEQTKRTAIEKLWVRPAADPDPSFPHEMNRLERMVTTRDRDGVLEWLRGLTEPASGEAP